MGEFFRVELQGTTPVRTSGDPEVVLRRTIPKQPRTDTDFLIAGPFGYQHDEEAPSGPSSLEVAVPVNPAESASDLASVPVWFGWIAAKTGRNLPAALIHDVLVVDVDRDGALRLDEFGRPRTPVNHWYRTDPADAFTAATEPYEGLDRRRADRMFRDGMGDIGVDPIRRWLMWAAVAAVTMWHNRPRGPGGVVDAIRLGLLALLMAAACLVIPYLGTDLAGEPFLGLPWGLEGAWWSDWVDVLALTAGLTIVAFLTMGILGRERHQWAIGMLVPAIAVLSWAALATAFGGLLLGLIRRIGKMYVYKEAGTALAYDSDTGIALVEVTGTDFSVGDRIQLVGGGGTPRTAKVAAIEAVEVTQTAGRHTDEREQVARVRVKLSPGARVEAGDEVLVAQRMTGSRDR